MKGVARYVTMGVLLVSMVALSACNTARGFGRDVQATGQAVEDTATDVQY